MSDGVDALLDRLNEQAVRLPSVVGNIAHRVLLRDAAAMIERLRAERDAVQSLALQPLDRRRTSDASIRIEQAIPAGEWTIADLRRDLKDALVEDKQVYNTLLYLSRTGRIERVGYGRYRTTPRHDAEWGQR